MFVLGWELLEKGRYEGSEKRSQLLNFLPRAEMLVDGFN
jgi:hypothetical protein